MMAASSWLALLIAAAGAAPAGAPPVRLAPVTCPGFPDADVRAALRVELRDRLVAETAPAPPDFALVSVACAGDDADLMIVHQGSGAPVRRRVPLSAAAPAARPRTVALAIAELLRVDLARNEPPPPTTPAPPPPSFMVAISGTPLVVGGSSSAGTWSFFTGIQLRGAFESATAPSPGRAWGWGLALALDDNNPNGDRYAFALGASALVRRHGEIFTWELGLGGRFGRAWDSRVDASPPAANFYGPFGALAVDAQVRDRGFSRMAIEAGADTGPLGGSWVRFVISGGVRF
jgi:hypothetical protein